MVASTTNTAESNWNMLSCIIMSVSEFTRLPYRPPGLAQSLAGRLLLSDILRRPIWRYDSIYGSPLSATEQLGAPPTVFQNDSASLDLQGEWWQKRWFDREIEIRNFTDRVWWLWTVACTVSSFKAFHQNWPTAKGCHHWWIATIWISERFSNGWQ